MTETYSEHILKKSVSISKESKILILMGLVASLQQILTGWLMLSPFS
jgi:hypothetical protein